ncbi:MAG: hypothetical protein IRZ32_03580, partial [Solirubrobacteraceae bacterium]|nr:hypothetical protein [Solirubrobacteraceae bacterium]
AVGAPVLLLLGDDTTAAWAALPVVALLAAHAPRAISFAAGQAGFTVTVLVVFDLVQRTG